MLGWIISALLAVHGAVPAPVPKIVVKVTADPPEIRNYINWLGLRSVRTDGEGDPSYTLVIQATQQANGFYVHAALSQKGQVLSDHERTCSDTPCLDALSNPARVREEVTDLLDEVLFKESGAFGYLILEDCEGPFANNSAILNVRPSPSGVLGVERGFYRLWWYDGAKQALSENTLHYLEPTTDRLTDLTRARFTTARGSVTTDTTPKWMKNFCAGSSLSRTKGSSPALKSPTVQFALVMQFRPPALTSKTTVPNHDTVSGRK